MWTTRMELDRARPNTDNKEPISCDLLDVLDAAEWSIKLAIPMLVADVASALWRASMRGLSVQVLLSTRPQNVWQTDMIKNCLKHDVELHMSKNDDGPFNSYAVIDSKMVTIFGESSKRGLREFEPSKEAP
ncbi:uncharacterized protein IUM83_18845 [Phytophthora cinnamomi]|uniref:uncharacterized protein n=1 Tax=Phytophthora cinnamomi TaxID=4785 RepID=UPI00355A0A9D|nr:hypothetical protein IUM83_18845 [Phytophthora cinnamomi]